MINADQPILVRGNRDTLYQALRKPGRKTLKYTAEHTEVEIAWTRGGSASRLRDRGLAYRRSSAVSCFSVSGARIVGNRRRQVGSGGRIAHRIAVVASWYLAGCR